MTDRKNDWWTEQQTEADRDRRMRSTADESLVKLDCGWCAEIQQSKVPQLFSEQFLVENDHSLTSLPLKSLLLSGEEVKYSSVWCRKSLGCCGPVLRQRWSQYGPVYRVKNTTVQILQTWHLGLFIYCDEEYCD